MSDYLKEAADEAADKLSKIVNHEYAGNDVVLYDCDLATVSFNDVRDLLTAYRAARESAVEVEVKPLVWEVWEKAEGGSTVWKGYSGEQFYKAVVHCDGSGAVYDLCCLGGAFRIEADTGANGADFYKAAAQADYARRIRSALAGG